MGTRRMKKMRRYAEAGILRINGVVEKKDPVDVDIVPPSLMYAADKSYPRRKREAYERRARRRRQKLAEERGKEEAKLMRLLGGAS